MSRESSAPVPTAKEINDAHRLARSTAETAVEHAIRCGKLLALKKASLPHGKFEMWVSERCDFALSTARKYMQAAAQNATGVAFSTLKSLIEQGNRKPQKQLDLPAPEPKKDAPAPLAQDSNQACVTLESASESRVASVPKGASLLDSEPQVPADYSEEEFAQDDAAAAESYERERQVSIDKWLHADEKLATAQAEIDRQAAEIVSLKTARNGWMSEKKAAIGMVKERDRRIAALERQLKKLEAENAALRERIAIMEAA